MLSTKEIQEFIFEKNWEALKQPEFFTELLNKLEFTITREFVLECFFTEDFRQAKPSFHAPSMNYQNNVFRAIEEQDIKLSLKEWLQILNFTKNRSEILVGYGAPYDIKFDNLLDFNSEDFTSFVNLSTTWDKTVTFDKYSKFALLFDDIEEYVDLVVKIIDSGKFFLFSFGEAISELPYDKVIEYIEIYFATHASVIAYFRFNPDAKVPDTLLKSVILGGLPWPQLQIIKNLSKKQIEKNIKYLHAKALFSNPDIDTDYILEKRPDIKNISQFRFFTEEFILKNPQHFNPEFLTKANTQGIYVSRETFKVLNKEWGRGRHYKADNFTFEALYYQLGERSIENLRYLKTKTKANNKEVWDGFDKLHSRNSSDVEILTKLNKKYGN